MAPSPPLLLITGDGGVSSGFSPKQNTLADVDADGTDIYLPRAVLITGNIPRFPACSRLLCESFNYDWSSNLTTEILPHEQFIF